MRQVTGQSNSVKVPLDVERNFLDYSFAFKINLDSHLSEFSVLCSCFGFVYICANAKAKTTSFPDGHLDSLI